MQEVILLSRAAVWAMIGESFAGITANISRLHARAKVAAVHQDGVVTIRFLCVYVRYGGHCSHIRLKGHILFSGHEL